MADMGGFEQRIRWLEAAERNLDALIKDILRRLARVEQMALTPSGGGRGGGGATIGWAYCPSGIAAAAVTGTGVALTLTPASASCYVATGRASGAWVLPGSTTTVFNDWPNSTGTGVAVNHWVQVYQDPSDFSWRVDGEQC